MRVLQVVTDTDRRGAQVFATDLDAALAARGHDVTTVALARGEFRGEFGGGLDLPVLGPARLSAATLRALRHRARDAEVVVAHGSSTLPACAMALAGMRTPFVYRQISDSLFWAPTRARRSRVRVLLRRAARVVALSAGQADVLVEHFGVRRDRVRVVPNGVPGDAFAPPSRDARGVARRAMGLDPDARVVLTIGALVPEKGVDRVIEALAAVDGASLLVAGDGPDRDELEAQAASALGGRARFVGSLADPLPAYHAADLVVLASRGGDSMPATLIEAGLCGLPAVATPIGAVPDVVVDGETGIVVAGGADALVDAIRAFLEDPDRAAAVGARAAEHCLRFEIGVVAAAWEAVLADVAAARR